MKIVKIHIHGLHQHENIELDNLDDFNVLIGPNNSGKTAILNAIAQICNKKGGSAAYGRNLSVTYKFRASVNESFHGVDNLKTSLKTLKPAVLDMTVKDGLLFNVKLETSSSAGQQDRNAMSIGGPLIKDDMNLWDKNNFENHEFPLNFDNVSNAVSAYVSSYLQKLLSNSKISGFPFVVYIPASRIEMNHAILIALRDGVYSSIYDDLTEKFSKFHEIFPVLRHTRDKTIAVIGNRPDGSEIHIDFGLEGDGCQRAFQLFHTVILLEKGRINASAKFPDLRPILIIDEPDLSLHTGLQRKMLYMLEEFSNNAEIFIATHSVIFALPSPRRKVILLPYARSKDAPKYVERTTVHKLTNVLGIKNEDVFLHSVNLYIEGWTEEAFLTTVLNYYQIDQFTHGVKIYNIEGIDYFREDFIELMMDLLLDHNIGIFITTDNENDVEKMKVKLMDFAKSNNKEDRFDWHIWDKNFESNFPVEILYDAFKRCFESKECIFDLKLSDFKSQLEESKSTFKNVMKRIFYEKLKVSLSMRIFGAMLAEAVIAIF